MRRSSLACLRSTAVMWRGWSRDFRQGAIAKRLHRRLQQVIDPGLQA
jgi:hypothetical protein